RKSYAVRVHQADDVIAELCSLTLHKLIGAGRRGGARQYYKEFLVRRSSRVEPGVMIIERPVDRRIRRVWRHDVRDEAPCHIQIAASRTARAGGIEVQGRPVAG